jgi:hypothetical protein
MSQSKLTRRGFAAAATGVAAIGLLGASAKSADNAPCLLSNRRSAHCGNPPQTKAAIAPGRWT